MLVVSECTAKAALEREESRGGHTREDFPKMDPEWRRVNLVCSLDGDDGSAWTQAGADDARRSCCGLFDRDELAKYLTDEELADGRSHDERRADRTPHAKEAADGHEAPLPDLARATPTAAQLQDYQVEVNEGEVVLDVIHRLQATQAPDLACRWNCKAGKCGSCSMEINGKPRLGCMTRMSTFEEDETVTVTPLRTFPVIRDLVTDVSFNYEKAREMPAFAPPAGPGPRRVPDAAGRRGTLAGVPQVHRVLPVPERLPRDP